MAFQDWSFGLGSFLEKGPDLQLAWMEGFTYSEPVSALQMCQQAQWPSSSSVQLGSPVMGISFFHIEYALSSEGACEPKDSCLAWVWPHGNSKCILHAFPLIVFSPQLKVFREFWEQYLASQKGVVGCIFKYCAVL